MTFEEKEAIRQIFREELRAALAPTLPTPRNEICEAIATQGIDAAKKLAQAKIRRAK